MNLNQIAAGTVVGHRYRVERCLGHGSLGPAYLSCDLADGKRLVALKVLQYRDVDGDQTGRLGHQLSVLSRLRHPGLASVLDYGTFGEGLVPYLVGEYIDGYDLYKTTGEWTSRQVIHLLVEICRALRYLHAREVLHCNLKPENALLVSGNGGGAGIKLLDFGLAPTLKNLKLSHSSGTLAYMAPEVILGEPPGPQADLYSLGVIAYQLFSRRLPFEDEDQEYLMQKHLQGSPDLRPIERVEYGPGLAQVLRGLLEKQPEKRPSSPDEVIRLLSAASGNDYITCIQPAEEFYFSSSRFVGRESEMSRLQEEATKVRETGRGTTVFIQGEAGLGKTRLFEEFRISALMNGWRVIDSNCIPGEGRSYEPYRSILARIDRIAGGDQAASFDEILRTQASARHVDSGWFDHSTETAASQFRDHLTRELVKHLVDQPTVLLLHDMHWADDATTAILDYLTSDISVHPVLVCVSLRPLKDDQVPLSRLMKQAVRQDRASVLTLEPLQEESVMEMIVSVTGSTDLGRAVGNWLATASGGNPYFVEETLKHLVDRGVLRHETQGWALEPNGLEGLEAPESVAAILQQRLDQVSPGAREIAGWIALFNRPIPMELLARLGNMAAPGLRLAVAELTLRQLLRVAEEGGKELCHFSHSLIAEVLVRRLPAARRRQLHRRIADAIEAICEAEGSVLDLAHHLTEGRCGERATAYALKAASLYKAQFAHEAAIRFYEYVLANPGDLSREAICQVAIEAAGVYCALGIPRRAIRLLLRHQRSWRSARDHEKRARLALCLSRCYQFMGNMMLSHGQAKIGLQTLAGFGSNCNAQLRSELLAQIAFYHMSRSETGRGLKLAKRALSLIAGCQSSPAYGHLHILIAGLFCVACDFVSGRRAAVIAIDSLRAINAIDLLPMAYSHLGINLAGQGRFKLAAKYQEEALELARQSRSPVLQAQALCNLAECYHRSGRFTEANSLSEEMLRLASSFENPHLAVAGQLCLAESLLNQGDIAGAFARLHASTTKEFKRLPAYTKSQALLLSAWLSLETGNAEEAARQLGMLLRADMANGRPYEAGLGKILSAQLTSMRQNQPSAIRILETLSHKFLRRGWGYHLCITKLHLSNLHLASSDYTRAQKVAQEALKLSTAMPARHLEAELHLTLGNTYLCKLENTEVSATARCILLKQADLEFNSALEMGRLLAMDWGLCRAYLGIARVKEELRDDDACFENVRAAQQYLAHFESKVPSDRVQQHIQMPIIRETMSQIRRLVEKSRATVTCEQKRLSEMENSQLRALLKTSIRLNVVREIDALLESICQLMVELTGFERVFVFLPDRDSHQLELKYGLHKDAYHVKNLDSEILSIAQHVYRDNRPLLTADAVSDGYGSNRACLASEIRSLMCGPLRFMGKAIGVIYIDTTVSLGHIPESFISFFATFLNIAAVAIDNTVSQQELLREQEELRQNLRRFESGCADILGSSAAACRLKERIQKLAHCPLDVLIWGETGTGKELVARALHRLSGRSSGEFVPVDCGSFSDTLFESELFGYRKGAFTGAVESRPGLLESANGGTIFLDEVSNLSLRLQAKLLRVVQEREFRRIGETFARKLDIRIIAATNKNLREEITKARFRKDLYYRLRSAEIWVPPLRDRKEDIPLLIDCFLSRKIQVKGQTKRFSSEAKARLLQYRYPGNVRELKSIVDSAYFQAEGRVIDLSDLHPDVSSDDKIAPHEMLDQARDLFELTRDRLASFEDAVRKPFLERRLTSETVRQVLGMALQAAAGRYKKAFRILGIPEKDYSVMMIFLKRHDCYLDFRPFRRRRRSDSD